MMSALKRAIPNGIKASIKSALPKRRSQAWTYDRDGWATVHNCDFIADPKFAEAYSAGKRTGSWGNSDVQWRAHTIAWAAERARSIPGDFVECGTNKGGLAQVAAVYANILNLDRRLWLFDTFEGLVDELINSNSARPASTGRIRHCSTRLSKPSPPTAIGSRSLREPCPTP